MVMDIKFFGVIAQVFGVVVGVFGIDKYLVTSEIVLPTSLCEKIPIPLSFSIFPYIIDNGSRYTPFRMIIVGFGIPFAVWRRSEKSSFETK